MEIQFCLAWLEKGRSAFREFKDPAAYSLFLEYVKRISKFSPCEILAVPTGPRKHGTKIWVCEREAEMFSSEELAKRFERLQTSGARFLQIIIGGADGFSKKELEQLKPDLKWSFGPLTLPHELAAVVASEQIYRAFTIQKRLPYHSRH